MIQKIQVQTVTTSEWAVICDGEEVSIYDPFGNLVRATKRMKSRGPPLPPEVESAASWAYETIRPLFSGPGYGEVRAPGEMPVLCKWTSNGRMMVERGDYVFCSFTSLEDIASSTELGGAATLAANWFRDHPFEKAET